MFSFLTALISPSVLITGFRYAAAMGLTALAQGGFIGGTPADIQNFTAQAAAVGIALYGMFKRRPAGLVATTANLPEVDAVALRSGEVVR